jgi:hypothetical protein
VTLDIHSPLYGNRPFAGRIDLFAIRKAQHAEGSPTRSFRRLMARLS